MYTPKLFITNSAVGNANLWIPSTTAEIGKINNAAKLVQESGTLALKSGVNPITLHVKVGIRLLEWTLTNVHISK
jgi:hypothetical protein